MTPPFFHAFTGALENVEAKLANYLPGLHVQLLGFQPGTALVPPHLLEALQTEYGEAGAQAVLAEIGLVQAGKSSLHAVLDWARDAGLDWAESLAGNGDDLAPDWHLKLCKVPQAWVALGGAGHIDWTGIRVGQIDTGYTPHPAFGFPGASWIDVAGGRNFMAATPAGGIDPLTGGSGGHGTTSGSILDGHDLVENYLGVAPCVPVVPARVNDCVILDEQVDAFARAARSLVDEAKVQVINVSMGTFLKFAPPPVVQQALDHCYESGVLVIAAAGNVPVRDWPAYPAALPRAIAVAGVTSEMKPWSWSSYGPWVDFSAPAMGVKRATAKAGPVYGYTRQGGGTTFATAMTSGAAALWLARHRGFIDAKYPQPWQRIEAFRAMARACVTVPENWTPDAGFGAGVLNVAGLMDPASLPAAADLVQR